MITDEQLIFIEQEIAKANITNGLLRDDLLDHMCCLVEIDIKKGLTFDQAYQKAYLQTSPNGYEEIQNETVFLLNKNKIIAMKQITYISGYVFSTAVVLGIMLKIYHLPGQVPLLFGGMVGLTMVFIPLILINKFKYVLNKVLSVKMKWVFGGITLALSGMTIALKILHMPGPNVLLMLTALVFSFGFLPFYFFRMYKNSLEHY